MGFVRNTISDKEHRERSMNLINNGVNSMTDLHELYFLYNDRLLPRKSDKACGSCKAYVWKALKNYYNV